MKNSDENLDLIKTEYQEGISTYRTQISLLIQIMTVLVVGDITIIGFALENQSSSLLIMGAIFPGTILIIRRIIKNLMIPIIQTCFRIENEYLSDDAPKLASTYILYTQESKNEDGFYKLRFTSSKIYTYIIFLISAGQLLSGLILNIFFNWKFI